jgi:hypothetical protein
MSEVSEKTAAASLKISDISDIQNFVGTPKTNDPKGFSDIPTFPTFFGIPPQILCTHSTARHVKMKTTRRDTNCTGCRYHHPADRWCQVANRAPVRHGAIKCENLKPVRGRFEDRITSGSG